MRARDETFQKLFVYYMHVLKKLFAHCCHRLKGIHSRSDTNRTGAKGLSFYYPRLLYCLNQMLAVMLQGALKKHAEFLRDKSASKKKHILAC